MKNKLQLHVYFILHRGLSTSMNGVRRRKRPVSLPHRHKNIYTQNSVDNNIYCIVLKLNCRNWGEEEVIEVTNHISMCLAPTINSSVDIEANTNVKKKNKVCESPVTPCRHPLSSRRSSASVSSHLNIAPGSSENYGMHSLCVILFFSISISRGSVFACRWLPHTVHNGSGWSHSSSSFASIALFTNEFIVYVSP